jgi:hypothetical protein
MDSFMKLAYTILALLLFLATCVPIIVNMSQNSQNLVTLHAIERNHGLIQFWSSTESGPSARYVTIPEDTSCKKVDDQQYSLVIGDQTLVYYKLICNGLVGYVDSAQIVQ